MPDSTLTTPPTGGMRTAERESADSRDLARFGYKQELKRILGPYSSFAVAFSYISPSTGIFTLYFLGLSIGGAFFFWSWPLVALGQFIVAETLLADELLDFGREQVGVGGLVRGLTQGQAREQKERCGHAYSPNQRR